MSDLGLIVSLTFLLVFRDVPIVNMKIKFTSLIFCFLFFPIQMVHAQNQRWTFVDYGIKNDERSTAFYIDKNFRTVPNVNSEVWTKVVKSDGSYLIALVEWNCAGKKNRVKQETDYDTTGDAITTKTDFGWEYIVPDSVNESVFRFVCSNANSKMVVPRTKTGATFAEITTKNANLRESPNLSSPVIRTVALGEKLVLADAEPVGAWYKVLDSKTKNECWLHGNTFKVVPAKKTQPKTKRGKRSIYV